MSTIIFQCNEIDTKIIKCKLEEKMEDVCRRYAKEINKDINRIDFFSNNKELNKSMKVAEFISLNPKKEIFAELNFFDMEPDNGEYSLSGCSHGGIAFDNISECPRQILFLNKVPNMETNIEKIMMLCKLTPDMLDERGNKTPSEWSQTPKKRGGFNYYPPTNNWIGLGLKVWNEYDNGNNDWISKDNNPNEWAVAYHGTSFNAIRSICQKDGKFFSNFNEGACRQKYKNFMNANTKSQNFYKKCGEGTYVSPNFGYSAHYASYGDKVLLMCRVNPNKIRIPQGQSKEIDWITDGTRNTIRPYRILIELK